MGIDLKIYAYEDNSDLFEVISLTGKEALLLANWFYTFYHRENVNKTEECMEYICFYIDEIGVIYEHLHDAMSGVTSSMPIYPVTSDSLSYIEEDSSEYYEAIVELLDLFTEKFYNSERPYKEDTMFFYNISW